MKVVPARADHRPPQLVQPGPGRPVTAKTKDALEAQGADTILLARDKPHRQEPLAQLFMGVLEDCAGRQRNLPTAGSTAQQAARHLCRFACHPAVWADEPVRPAKPADILSAGRFCAETRLELAEGPRVISSVLRRACIDHAPILSIAAGCVKCIPTFWNCVAVAIEYAGGLRNGALQSRELPDSLIAHPAAIWAVGPELGGCLRIYRRARMHSPGHKGGALAARCWAARQAPGQSSMESASRRRSNRRHVLASFNNVTQAQHWQRGLLAAGPARDRGHRSADRPR